MPELPEVETVKKGIEGNITGASILEIYASAKALRAPIPHQQLKLLLGQKIVRVRRRAKYLVLDSDRGISLIIHLGMSGSLILTSKHYELRKHDHLILTLSNNYKLIFNDPRRFGLIDACCTNDFEKLSYIKTLGPEPFDEGFSSDYLKNKFNQRVIAIKQALMDSKIVVGIGNIYACEILFLSGISPLRQACMVTAKETEKIYQAAKSVLAKAIEAGGSTLRDYKKADGSLGAFQNNFLVYGRAGAKCFICGGAIKRVVQAGRSSFYCPVCQK